MPIKSFLWQTYMAMLVNRKNDLENLLKEDQDLSGEIAFAQAFILRFLEEPFEEKRQSIITEFTDEWPFVISFQKNGAS